MAKLSPTELHNGLTQFTGTTQYYYLPMMKKYNYTDGVRYLAQNAECYWLLEFIFSHQLNAKIKKEPFQVWKIEVLQEGGAKIWVEDGNDKVVETFQIPFTDFPLSTFELWMEGHVLLLPSEH